MQVFLLGQASTLLAGCPWQIMHDWLMDTDAKIVNVPVLTKAFVLVGSAEGVKRVFQTGGIELHTLTRPILKAISLSPRTSSLASCNPIYGTSSSDFRNLIHSSLIYTSSLLVMACFQVSANTLRMWTIPTSHSWGFWEEGLLLLKEIIGSTNE